MASPVRGTELIGEITEFIYGSFPENMPAALMVHKIGHRASGVLRVSVGGRQVARSIPSRVFTLLSELKDVMAMPATGTWITVEIQVSPEGSAATRFDYASPIVWGPTGGPEPDAYLLELARYPRDQEKIPGWWQAKIDNPAPRWTPSQEYLQELDALVEGPGPGNDGGRS